MNTATPSSNQDRDLQQMLTFALGDESFGVDIQRVQEIRGWSPVTPIPEAPAHILGVLNLRGTIVPIIDLRARIGMDVAGNSATTVIIVLSVHMAEGDRLFGIVVDRVSDVVNINAASLRAVPAMGCHGNVDYLRGLVSQGDTMTMLLDIDRLLSGDGMSF
jgi:purine-binding chemotaxis protein CheW